MTPDRLKLLLIGRIIRSAPLMRYSFTPEKENGFVSDSKISFTLAGPAGEEYLITVERKAVGRIAERNYSC